MTDYYEILGVTNEATTEEIKKAHRGLMKEHHPDKNAGQLTDRCRDIQEAYDCLSKPESRAHYDEYGLALATKQFEEVQKLAIQVSSHVLSQGVKPSQFIFEVDYQLNQALDTHKSNLDIHASSIKKLTEMKGAVKLKDENQMDLVGMALDEMIELQRGSKLQLEGVIEIHETLLKNVDHYEQ